MFVQERQGGLLLVDSDEFLGTFTGGVSGCLCFYATS
jgi:hypothetical protein